MEKNKKNGDKEFIEYLLNKEMDLLQDLDIEGQIN
jgi:hypothetical protein